MSLSGLGIALTLTFGSLLLALVSELCYLFLWKKRTNHTETDQEIKVKGMLYGKCWKTTQSTTVTNSVSLNSDSVNSESKTHEPDLELGHANSEIGEEGVELELMRLHNLAGPPRFLFTIKEETKEDLESEDCKSRTDSRSRKGSRTRSLSDLMVAIDTPFLNPVNSSNLKSSLENLECCGFNFNPLFESSSSSMSMEFQIDRFRSSSPPPKFKFLRDAEEKLYRRLVEEAKRKVQMNLESDEVRDFSPNFGKENREMNLIKNFINNNEKEQKEIQQCLPQFPSSSSQVLPFRTIEKGSMVH